MTVLNKSYLISFGNLTNPSFYANHLEPIAVGLYLMVPPLQVTDLTMIAEIAKLTPTALFVLLLMAIWRGELVTKREAERMRAEAIVLLEAIATERERERAAFQARFETMEKSYLARLDEKDRHQTDSDKQVQVLIKLVQEGTLMLGQAAALVGNQKTT